MMNAFLWEIGNALSVKTKELLRETALFKNRYRLDFLSLKIRIIFL